mmetsp:Transcript_22524/g.57162  ORF Transcript_22524/g.57162 Transcript_22524/m.57162 type:complete len:228 (+) Transcript_22524:721-1404(+)
MRRRPDRRQCLRHSPSNVDAHFHSDVGTKSARARRLASSSCIGRHWGRAGRSRAEQWRSSQGATVRSGRRPGGPRRTRRSRPAVSPPAPARSRARAQRCSCSRTARRPPLAPARPRALPASVPCAARPPQVLRTARPAAPRRAGSSAQVGGWRTRALPPGRSEPAVARAPASAAACCRAVAPATTTFAAPAAALRSARARRSGRSPSMGRGRGRGSEHGPCPPAARE